VAAAAAGFDEDELAVEGDVVGYAQALIEVEEVDAAAEEDMLAVVDNLASGFVGRCSAA
jgi:hypothetical protein